MSTQGTTIGVTTLASLTPHPRSQGSRAVLLTASFNAHAPDAPDDDPPLVALRALMHATVSTLRRSTAP